ncbi:MAG: hypothetical protein A2W07_00630 [candidate division Zixibacteria bacterium RBG_16_43_9]|nr:MAG: hypothetical protein A2W07_00630 [candidate division Zixibacteria bacterium RBG_16_43_9]
MRPVQKLFLLGLLFSVLSFLPISVSESDTKFDLENKASPRLNSITSSIVDDFLVNDDTGSGTQMDPAISTDPFYGNFVLTWDDNREFYPKIYAQRLDYSGARLGINFKVNDDTGTGWQLVPAIGKDLFGNFVIVWWDWNCGICGQRFSISGTPLGARFAANSYNPQGWVSYPAIAVDLFGDFIITWQEENYYFNSNIYAQLFDSSGTASDSTFRVEYGATSYAHAPSIALDGSGNFMITWADKRADGTYQVYAQRFNSAGTPLGSNFKVSDLNVTASQASPAAAANWSGDFIITWEDYRNGHFDIYAQRFDSSGSPIDSNFKVNDGAGSAYPYQYSPSIAVDVQGSGSFVITWEDGRNGNADIYAQRYDSSASRVRNNYMVNDPQFASFAQTTPDIAVNGSKLFFTWMDTRRGNRDIYAKIVDWNWTEVEEEELANLPNSYELSQNFPNPFNPYTNISFSLKAQGSTLKGSIRTSLIIYNILGQKVKTLLDEEKLPGSYKVIWDGKDDLGKEVASGIYFYQLKTPDYTATKKMILLR